MVNNEAPWELFYWTVPTEDGKYKMIGRGEFVRLMFEATGTPYIDVGKGDDKTAVFKFARGGGN